MNPTIARFVGRTGAGARGHRAIGEPVAIAETGAPTRRGSRRDRGLNDQRRPEMYSATARMSFSESFEATALITECGRCPVA